MTKRFGKVESYKVKQGVFAGIVLLVIVVGYLFLTNAIFIANLVMIVGGLALFFVLVKQYDYLLTLKEYERAVIYRFGRVNRVGGPGWAFLVPVIETFRIVDLRTQTLDVKPQTVITKDNIVVIVDAVIFLFVNPEPKSVINSVIEVDDYKRAATQFVQAKIRDVAGGLTLSELISDVGKLNSQLQKELSQIATNWGIKVESVEIQNLEIPKDVEEAFAKRAAAEQGKLAQIQRALGTQAEIESIREAAQKLDDKSLSYFYIRTLEALGQSQSTKYILPLELTSLIQTLSSQTKKIHSKAELENVFEKYAPAFYHAVQQTKKPVQRKLQRKAKKKKKK